MPGRNFWSRKRELKPVYFAVSSRCPLASGFRLNTVYGFSSLSHFLPVLRFRGLGSCLAKSGYHFCVSGSEEVTTSS